MESFVSLLNDVDVGGGLREVLNNLGIRSSAKLRSSFKSGHEFAHMVDERRVSKLRMTALSTMEIPKLPVLWRATHDDKEIDIRDVAFIPAGLLQTSNPGLSEEPDAKKAKLLGTLPPSEVVNAKRKPFQPETSVPRQRRALGEAIGEDVMNLSLRSLEKSKRKRGVSFLRQIFNESKSIELRNRGHFDPQTNYLENNENIATKRSTNVSMISFLLSSLCAPPKKKQ